jgi:hypothetical protein
MLSYFGLNKKAMQCDTNLWQHMQPFSEENAK